MKDEMIQALRDRAWEVVESATRAIASDPPRVVPIDEIVAPSYIHGFDDGVRFALEDAALGRLLVDTLAGDMDDVLGEQDSTEVMESDLPAFVAKMREASGEAQSKAN